MKIFVTGGTGFIGRPLVRLLRARGHTVIAPGRADVWNALTYAEPSGYDAMIHAAPIEDPLVYAFAKQVKRVLFTSSGAAEMASTDYGAKKLRSELEFGGRALIARLWTFGGPGLPAHYALSDFIRQAKAGGPVVVRNGAPYRSYLHVSDCATWLAAILERGSPDRIYNVGSEYAIQIRGLASIIADLYNVEYRVDTMGQVERYVPNTLYTRQMLHLTETYTLREIIKDTP